MDNMLEFSVSDWGITLNSAPLYFNLSWGLIILAIGAVIARKIMLNNRAKKLWQQAIDDERANNER